MTTWWAWLTGEWRWHAAGNRIGDVGGGGSRNSVESCNNTRVGLSQKHGISCQEERFSFCFRVSMTGRTAANRGRTVKTRVEKLFVWSISPPRRSFFRGKNRIAFRKETNRLPQRRNFFAARHSLRVQKEGKNRASEGFPALDGVRPRANSVCPFAGHSPCGADARSGLWPHGVPWRAAKCRGNRLSAFILHILGRARFAYFRPVPVPHPSARFSQRLF